MLELRSVYQALLRHPRRRRRQLLRPPRRGHRLPRPQRLRQIHHHEDDHRPHRHDLRPHPLRGQAHPRRPDRLQAPHGLRPRGALPLQPSLRRRIPHHGRAAPRSARHAQSSKRIDGMLRLFASTTTATPPSPATPRACARRFSSPPRSCTIPISSCSTSHSPASTSARRSSCAASSRSSQPAAKSSSSAPTNSTPSSASAPASSSFIAARLVADDSIEHLRSLMELPTLEAIFSQLAVEQDTASMSRQIADLIHA